MQAIEVFNRAMALIDEISESTYLPDPSDSLEYKSKSKLIMNILIGQLYKYSDTYVPVVGKHPVPPQLEDKELTDDTGLDDYISGSILPYGLAAHLIQDENPTLAAFFSQKYQEGLAVLQQGFVTEFTDIEDVYGGSGRYDRYGRW